MAAKDIPFPPPIAKKKGFKVDAKKSDVTSRKEFLPVRVSNFDKMLDEGGIERGNTIMVSGGTGSGKTTFCLQSAIHGLESGEKVLYVSFEENPAKMMAHMRQNYNWDFEQYIKKGSFVIIEKDPFALNRAVEAELATLRGKKLLIDIKGVSDIIPANFKPDRIIIDSLSALSSAFEDNKENYRIYLTKLFKELEVYDSINFVISETEQEPDKYSRTGVEEFLVDGVVVLYNIRQGQVRERGIEILKMRCSNHSKSLVPYSLTSKGMEIHHENIIFLERKE